ncbi:MAG TPA: asparagine synthase (glutamine-hydrolyzing) [Alphaproteobacteria bacterium]|nr:asparagine synthase (glutamine-hydrolyzing) [Alphaproteobacteria bacterium]
MCGITGFNWNDEKLLKRMADAVMHRGPNDVAYHFDKNLSLGMRRLSIIDLTKGIYPLTNEAEDIFCIFNGEIYNFQELRRVLVIKGHKFKTNCDGETIVHAYEEYGEAFLERLNGMYAIALYDSKKKVLIIARDRIGIKPLYYYTGSDGKFAFSSEIKSILEITDVKREVNADALNNYLSLRYNPLEETFFKGIFRLKPGHYIKLDVETGKYDITKYWDISLNQVDRNGNKSAEFYANHLYFLLKDSVRKVMISDVPLGVYLSGGVDSSAIVAMMRELIDEKKDNATIKTYNISFADGEKVNESVYANQVSKLFNTDHKEFVVEPNLVELLPKIAYHTDEPLSDPALIPLYLLSKESKKTSTVVLTGDGGDELFAGYDHHKILKATNIAGKIPGFKHLGPKMTRAIPLKTWDKFHKYASDLGEDAYVRSDELIRNIKHDKAKAYYALFGTFSEEERKKLLETESYKDIDFESLNKEYFSQDKNQNGSKQDYVSQLLLFDTKRMLPELFLMKTDKMTMANCVESRVPFLDHRIVELAFNMPSDLKLRGINHTKYILKKSLHSNSNLPSEILYRKKQGFHMPVENWLNSQLKDSVQESLGRENLPPMIKREYVDGIYKKYSDGKLYYARQLWSLMTYSLWYRQFILKEKLNK